MPTVWFALKKSLHCKTDPTEVQEPKSHKTHLGYISTRKGRVIKTGRSGCSRSITNLKDVVVHGSRRHLERTPNICSPRSIGSNELLNPITHEVILNNSKCELKITSFNVSNSEYGFGSSDDVGENSAFLGTLTPGTPGPSWQNTVHYNPIFKTSGNNRFPRKVSGFQSERRSLEIGSNGGLLSCHKCGYEFRKLEIAEQHHLSNHAVTELIEGDSSRKIVEIICKTNWSKPDNNIGRIERVLKVHNMQKTLARFEEYRETVKTKANKLPKKHPRCLADGNELLRFYGTTIACSLGTNGSSNICLMDTCNVCRIIRYGFSTKMELKKGIGVFTTSTSARAFESIELYGKTPLAKKALIVCRVIAGRVHRPLENFQEMADQTGFDSLAGRMGVSSNIEELYLLNPRALLPCFVVICKA